MHKVSLTAFQMAKYPVTVAEFKKFARDTGFNPKPECEDSLGENWLAGPESIGTASWDKHRYSNSDYLPVTCVSWQDANTTSRYFWGDDPNMTQACLYGNFADQSGEYFASKQYGASYVGFLEQANCDDGEAYNSMVGLYRPNPFGLYDMVGNTSEYLATCYYEGYQPKTAEQMDVNQCEFIAHRGETWHYPPQPTADRGRAKKEGWTPDALTGFRLAADGHNEQTDISTRQFETTLKAVQAARLATRAKLPPAPTSTQLVKIKNNTFKLRWQPADDARVTGYDIYQSHTPYAHLQGKFYQRHYDKIHHVSAMQSAIEVSLPSAGGSFRVVTVTDKLTSLPSPAAVFVQPQTLNIPGRIKMQDTMKLENVHLAYKKAKDDKPELYYLSKFNKGLELPLVTATFKVNVQKTAWYSLNYRGRTGNNVEFFKLWQNNTLVGEISYDANIDDKTSKRHKAFLTEGTHTLQLSVMREGWDFWSMVWLEFSPTL